MESEDNSWSYHQCAVLKEWVVLGHFYGPLCSWWSKCNCLHQRVLLWQYTSSRCPEIQIVSCPLEHTRGCRWRSRHKINLKNRKVWIILLQSFLYTNFCLIVIIKGCLYYIIYSNIPGRVIRIFPIFTYISVWEIQIFSLLHCFLQFGIQW